MIVYMINNLPAALCDWTCLVWSAGGLVLRSAVSVAIMIDDNKHNI